MQTQPLFQRIEAYSEQHPESPYLPNHLAFPLCRAFKWDTGPGTLYGYDFALRAWTEPDIEPAAQAAYTALYQEKDLPTTAQTVTILRQLKAALEATNQPVTA